MGEVKHGTSIGWTHGEGRKGETWNPVVGCSIVSTECKNCYAAELHKTRLSGQHGYPVYSPWTPANAAQNVTLLPHKLEQPLRWRQPRMIFVNSMSDMFHELVPDDFLDRIFEIMEACPQHVFQVLTKRPERMREYVDDWGHRVRGFLGEEPAVLPNVWLGTSVGLRQFVGRADHLRATPAAVRFVSAEPLLGPLVVHDEHPELDGPLMWPDDFPGPELYLRGIDWLIVGGESGPGYRPMQGEWVRDLYDACQEFGTAFFFKQDCGPLPGRPGRFKGWPQEYPQRREETS